VQDDYTFVGDPNNTNFNTPNQLTLENNASITATAGSLTIANQNPDDSEFSPLELNILGNITESGAVNLDQPRIGPVLVAYFLRSATMNVPQSPEMQRWLIVVGSGPNTKLELGDGTTSSIGALGGSGEVDIEGSPNDGTDLSINPSAGVGYYSDVVID